MIKRERKIFSRFIFNPKILACLGLIIIVLLSFPIAKNLSKRYAINKEIKELEEEIKSIEERNSKLSKLIDYLNSEQYLEEQARLNFGLRNKGEEVAIIETGKNGATTTNVNSLADISSKEMFNIPATGIEQPSKLLSNPQRWWRYFIKN